MVATVPAKMITWEEYLNLPDDLVHSEIIDGKVIELAAPLIVHQVVVSRLIYEMQVIAARNNLGMVLTAPSDVVIENVPLPVRQPDVFFLSTSTLRAMGDLTRLARIDVPPDLVVVVLSPSESAESVLDKMRDYFKRGIREMWLLNPAKKRVELFQADNGSYRPSGLFTRTQAIQSVVLPDLDLTPDRIFE